MSRDCLILIDPVSGLPGYAVLVDERGLIAAEGEPGSLDFAALAFDRTVLIAPGEAVGTHRLTLPPGPESQARTAAAFAIEDFVSRPVDELHLALGEDEETGRRVAVTDADALRGWIESVRVLGLEPDLIAADYDLLPREEGTVSVAMIGGRVFVTGPGLGFTAAPDLAAPILSQILETERLGALWTEEDADLTPFGPALSGAPRNEAADYAALLRQGLAGERYTDLRQGEFAPRRPFLGDMSLLARAAALLAAAFLGWTLLVAAQGWALNNRADDLRAEADALFRQTFPEEGRVVNAAMQMETRLRGLRAGGGGAFLDLSAILTDSIEALEDVQLESVRFDSQNGELTARLLYDEFQDIERLKTEVARRGAALEEGASQQQGDGFAGEVRVTAS